MKKIKKKSKNNLQYTELSFEENWYINRVNLLKQIYPLNLDQFCEGNYEDKTL